MTLFFAVTGASTDHEYTSLVENSFRRIIHRLDSAHGVKICAVETELEIFSAVILH